MKNNSRKHTLHQSWEAVNIAHFRSAHQMARIEFLYRDRTKEELIKAKSYLKAGDALSP